MLETRLETFQAWVLYLSESEIPVLRRSIDELARLKENEDNITSRDIANVLLHDPLLSLKVIRYLQEHRKQSQTTDITTGARAAMMLGTTPSFNSFAGQTALEDHLRDHPQALAGIMRVLSRSFHAAIYAREMATLRHDAEVDEITEAALLHDLAEILLWCFAPKFALQIRDLQNNDATLRSSTAQQQVLGFKLLTLQQDPTLRSSAAQQTVLGFRTQTLQQALNRIWHMPQLLQDLMDDNHPESPRALNVSLAVALARHTANGWYDAALPDDYQGIQALLRLDADHTRQIILRSTLLAARSAQWYACAPSAALLPLEPPSAMPA